MDDPASPAPPAVPGLTGFVVLARGGYSTVYRAVQVSVGRDVAVKIENWSLDNDHDRRRFVREARAAGRMSSHSFVVDLFDAGVTEDGHPYLVMELCAGSYADLLRQRPLSASEARDVGVKIADALADAHEVGVLHRDVKPANILITEFGEPTLADFGLAVLAEMRDVATTLEVLTPAYAPREMFRQRCEPSPAADVYSLCATLYALLHGKPARWRDDRNPSLLTLMELFEQPIPDLPGVPADLTEVLRAGMANDPRARPTAAELRDRLEALSLRRTGDAVPVQVAVRQPTPPALDVPGSWSQPTQPRPVGPAPATDPHATVPARRRWRSFGGAAALALVLGLLITSSTWYGLHHRGSPALATLGSGSSAVAPSAGAPAGSATDPDPSGGRGAGQDPATGPGPAGQGAASGQGAAVAPASCGFGLTGAVCPSTAECFDRLVVVSGVVRTRSLPCDRPHTWQTFAVGRLPAGEAAVRYSELKTDPRVRQLCNPATLALVDLADSGWQVDVLPPSPEAFAGGDRSFRCLAGTGPDGQSVPAFVH